MLCDKNRFKEQFSNAESAFPQQQADMDKLDEMKCRIPDCNIAPGPSFMKYETSNRV